MEETNADEAYSYISRKTDDSAHADVRSGKEESLSQDQSIDQRTVNSKHEQESGTTFESTQWEMEDEPDSYDAQSSNRRRRTTFPRTEKHPIVQERVNLSAQSYRHAHPSKGLKHINRKLPSRRVASISSTGLSYATLKKTIRREIQECLREEEERKARETRISAEVRAEIQEQELSRYSQNETQTHARQDGVIEPSTEGGSPLTPLVEDPFEELQHLLPDESEQGDKGKEPKEPNEPPNDEAKEPSKSSNEPEANGNSDDDRKPMHTWVRSPIQYLSPVTLNDYNLPWQYDESDPNYIIIRKWISRKFHEELFSHTAELRHQWESRTKEGSGNQQGSEGQRYRPPLCAATEKPLSFGILMKSALGDQNKFTPSTPLFRASIRGVRSVEISSSRISGYGKIDMYRKHGIEDKDPTQMTWMHVEREAADFEEFTTFAIQAPGLYKQDVALILKLLAEVRKEVRITEDGGLHDDCTLRCVSRHSSGSEKEEKSATFMSFPYFSVESFKKDSQRRLLQTYYHQTTALRERGQAIRMTGLFPSDHITFVPQLWAIVLNSKLLITCAPISFSQIAANSLNIADSPRPRSSSGPSIIRLTDHNQRVFFIPMDHCQTWFALIDKVKNGCLSDIDLTRLELQLFTITGNPVHAETWHAVSKGHKSTILPLSVRLIEVKAPKPAQLTVSDTPKLQGRVAELAGEDSPEQSVVSAGGMALVKRRPTWAQEEEGKDTAATAQSKISDQHRSSDREVGRLLPPNSGIINNVPDITSAKEEEDVYFLPDNVLAKGTFSPTSEKENTSSSTGNSIRSTGTSPSQHGGTGATPSPTPNINVDPKLVEQEKAQSNASPSSSAEIKPNVPPVFTWSIGERSKPDHESASGDFANLAQWNYSQNNIITSEEESLSYVCGYLHTQLSGTTENKDLYMGTPSKSFAHIENLIRDTFSISVTMLEEENQTEHSTSGPAIAPRKFSLKGVTTILLRLLGLFMPAAYKCEVGEKYMGALSDILTGICDLCILSQKNSPDRHKANIFEIVDISGPTEADLRATDDLDLLEVPIMDCVRCQKGEKYSTREDAMGHLLQAHFRAEAVLKTNTHWVMDNYQMLNLQARRAGERVIHALVDNCVELEEIMWEIRYGVSGNGEFDRDTYRISKSLVKGFQHLLLMLAYAAKGIRDGLQKVQGHTSDDSPPLLLELDNLQRQIQCGAHAERSLGDAKREILLMTFTDDSSAIGTYQAGSPELVLATIMDDLRCRDSNNDTVDLVEIYRVYMLGLETRVIQNPGHRLLSDIRLAMQELEIIEKFTMKQRLLCVNYKVLLAPSSFRITTASRQASFNFEKSKLDDLIGRLDDDAESIERLLEKADSLAKATRSGVEVRQEDHGKAILAFTIVTVIFLPLSFVTSFLGMNTTDIRDTNHTQQVFWAAALPLTALIIIVSLVVGFKGYDLQEFIYAQQWWGSGNWWKLGSRRSAPMRILGVNPGLSILESCTLPSSYHDYTEPNLGENMSWGGVVARIKRWNSRRNKGPWF